MFVGIQQAEEARILGLSEAPPYGAAHANQKSPSEESGGSLQLYRLHHANGGSAGGRDRDQISMKSDFGIDTRRRLSVVNGREQKVCQMENVAECIYIYIYIYNYILYI